MHFIHELLAYILWETSIPENDFTTLIDWLTVNPSFQIVILHLNIVGHILIKLNTYPVICHCGLRVIIIINNNIYQSATELQITFGKHWLLSSQLFQHFSSSCQPVSTLTNANIQT